MKIPGWNPNKRLHIEIESNDTIQLIGYTIWRVINGHRKNTLSRNADAKDFDWMTDKQMKDFESGKFKFTILAKDASEYFSYYY